MVLMVIEKRLATHTLPDKTNRLIHMRCALIICINLEFNPVQIQNTEAVVKHQQQRFPAIAFALMGFVSYSNPQIGRTVIAVHILNGDITDRLIIVPKCNQQQHRAVIFRFAPNICRDLLLRNMLLRSCKPAGLRIVEHMVIQLGVFPVQRAQIYLFPP
ncbi:hypothetical protein D3C74_346180 [compost metagenome]